MTDTTNFILLDSTTTLADVSNAVKMKWGYVLMGKVKMEVVTVDGETKLKVTAEH